MHNPRVLEEETYDSLLEVEVYGEVVSRYWVISHNWIVEQALNYGKRGGSLLDVGAGTGHVVTSLAEYNFFNTITAVDSSPVMLAAAQEKAKRAGMADKINFVEADAVKLPFEDHSFDTVICHNTLHHFADPAALVAEIIRVTKPEGQFFIRDMHRPRPVILALMEHFVFPLAGSSRKQSVDSLKAALSFSELQALAQRFPGVAAVRKGIIHISLQRTNAQPTYVKVGPRWARPLAYFKV